MVKYSVCCAKIELGKRWQELGEIIQSSQHGLYQRGCVGEDGDKDNIRGRKSTRFHWLCRIVARKLGRYKASECHYQPNSILLSSTITHCSYSYSGHHLGLKES